jgi:hypothetical protein
MARMEGGMGDGVRFLGGWVGSSLLDRGKV